MAKLALDVVEGEVTKSETWSETRVSVTSSGGGGYIGPQGGNVSAPTVSSTSTVTEKQRVFFRSSDGLESDLKLSNWPFGFREGQTIRVAYESGSGFLAGIRNLSTGRVDSVSLSNERVKKHMKRGVGASYGHLRLVSIALLVLIGSFFGVFALEAAYSNGTVTDGHGIGWLEQFEKVVAWISGGTELNQEQFFVNIAILFAILSVVGWIAAAIRWALKAGKVRRAYYRAVEEATA